MTRLSQILAIEKGVKARGVATFNAAYQSVQKPALLSGLSRTYQPKDEEGDPLPPESTRVQLKVEKAIKLVAADLARLFDVTATKDWNNCVARADVKVGDQVLIEGAPVTYLLFLEKQLVDLNTFVRKLPVLDPSESWTHDQATDTWKTEPVQTIKTKKTPRNHVKAEATNHHPAQVEVYYEDIAVGTWTTVKFSGAVPQTRVNELLHKVETLQAAVKFAREEANGTVVTDQKPGEVVLGWIFS